jgi:hypothetical protein
VAPTRYAVPASILLGFAMLSAAIYFGLSRSGSARVEPSAHAVPDPGSPPLPAARSAIAADLSEPSTSALPPRDELSPRLLQQVTHESAQSAFGTQQPEYVRKCYAGKGAIGDIFQVKVTFDAGGHETQREFLPRPEQRGALLDCVRALKLPPLSIRAPGLPGAFVVNLGVP